MHEFLTYKHEELPCSANVAEEVDTMNSFVIANSLPSKFSCLNGMPAVFRMWLFVKVSLDS